MTEESWNKKSRNFDAGRRELLRKIALGSAVYAVPTVASFSMQGIGGVAQAQVANQPIPTTSDAGVALLAGGLAAAAAVSLKKRRDGNESE
jgi:hypothetical protein